MISVLFYLMSVHVLLLRISFFLWLCLSCSPSCWLFFLNFLLRLLFHLHPKFCCSLEFWSLLYSFLSLGVLINPVAQRALLSYDVLLSSRSINYIPKTSPMLQTHKTVQSDSVRWNSNCPRLKWASFPGIFTSHIKWQGMPIDTLVIPHPSPCPLIPNGKGLV